MIDRGWQLVAAFVAVLGAIVGLVMTGHSDAAGYVGIGVLWLVMMIS